MAPCVSQRRDGEINESGLTMVPRGYLRANLLMKDPASEHLISSDKSAKPIFRALQKVFNRRCASHLPAPPRALPLCQGCLRGALVEQVERLRPSRKRAAVLEKYGECDGEMHRVNIVASSLFQRSPRRVLLGVFLYLHEVS